MLLHLPAFLAAQSASVVHSTQDHVPLICTQPGYGATHAEHWLVALEAAHLWVDRSHFGPTVLAPQFESLVHSTHVPSTILIGVGAWHAPVVAQVCEFASQVPPGHCASVRQPTQAPPKHLPAQLEHALATVQLAP